MKKVHQATPSTSRYVFHNVPNTKEGRKFIADAKQYLNEDQYVIEKRNRGKRASSAKAKGLHPRSYDQGLPTVHATSFCVYVNAKPKARYQVLPNHQVNRLSEALKENRELHYKLNKAEKMISNIRVMVTQDDVRYSHDEEIRDLLSSINNRSFKIS